MIVPSSKIITRFQCLSKDKPTVHVAKLHIGSNFGPPIYCRHGRPKRNSRGSPSFRFRVACRGLFGQFGIWLQNAIWDAWRSLITQKAWSSLKSTLGHSPSEPRRRSGRVGRARRESALAKSGLKMLRASTSVETPAVHAGKDTTSGRGGGVAALRKSRSPRRPG